MQPKISVIFLAKLSHFILNSQRNILEYNEMTLILYHFKMEIECTVEYFVGSD